MGLSLGIGVGLTKGLQPGASQASPRALTLAAGLANAFAFSFADSYYYTTTGFYGSMYVADTGTPANDYQSSPRGSGTASKITVSGSSLKTVRRADGYLDFAPHNMALRSDDVTNASWSKIGTCTAASATQLNTPASGDRVQQFLTAGNCVGRTLIFSATLSGNAGETCSLIIYYNGFTSRTIATLTATPTRYVVTMDIPDTATDVRIWIDRSNTAPVDTATIINCSNMLCEATWHRTTQGPFIATTSAIVFEPAIEWDSTGAMIGARFEEARTNLCLRGSDLTNAAWTASNMTAARTATGPNNRANFATTLTATAGNATVLQAITSGSAARKTGCWIKRRTGSGTVEMTQDNGSTWAAVTVTSAWTLVEIATATLANPTVGLRVATSGDAVDVAFFQHETTSNVEAISSPIYTVAASVTRAVDNFSTALTNAPAITTAATIYARCKPLAQLRGAARTAISVAATSSNTMKMGFRTASLDDLEGSITSGGAATLAIVGGAISAANGNKVALAVAANDGEFVADGVSLGTDASTGVPSGSAPTHVVYGADGTGVGTPLNGWLIEGLVTPVRMSQANMITLTAA